jgi:DNA polymerase
MHTLTLKKHTPFAVWRDHARSCLAQNLNPSQILWQDGDAAQDLFTAEPQINTAPDKPMPVPRSFIDMAELAICHADPQRYALLYKILWRLCHENRALLNLRTDNDIMRLSALIKAVRRDAYKIKAFLRFQQVEHSLEENFVAWYEPEHYSLELSLPFFQTRFRNMTWSILTPYLTAHWDRENLTLAENENPEHRPQKDRIEEYWLKYYATTFNPARPKKQAMLTQMPKKYWKNMPETVLIKEMLQTSEARAKKMIENGK